jgi:hypothetical protein
MSTGVRMCDWSQNVRSESGSVTGVRLYDRSRDVRPK